MAIDRITRKILDDADAESKLIAAETDREIEDRRSRAVREISAIQEKAAEAAVEAGRDQKNRMISRAQAEMRKEILGEKQNLIQKAFEQAGEKVMSLDDVHYGAVMKKLLLESAETGDEDVIIAEKDAGRDWDTILGNVNKELSERGLKGGLTLSPQTRVMTGGFVLRQGKKERNCDVGLLLRSLREEIESDIVKILFPES